MFHPAIVQKRLTKLADAVRVNTDPLFTFRDYSREEIDEWNEKLDAVYNPVDGSLLRTLTVDEESYIRHQILRCKADFRYWLENFCWIKGKEATLIRVSPTHVQELFLKKAADAEMRSLSGKTNDGLLFAVLKARQLGVSTIADCIVAYRINFYGNIAALVASDVEEHTQNLYEIIARIFDHLPWWMKARSDDPKKDSRVKNKMIAFADQDSLIRFSSGKNMQGGQDQEKGSIGTGQTIHIGHVSEFALWPNAEQVYDALLPSIPVSSKTFFVIESTAKGRGNEWHLTWERAKKGLGRLTPIFFPYYTDPYDYRTPAPEGWQPLPHTLEHAHHVEDTSHQWLGKTTRLTTDQMFWYENKYAEYKDARMLYKLYAEFAIDDLSAFQATTMGPFNSEMIEDMRMKANGNPTLVEIRPRLTAHVHTA